MNNKQDRHGTSLKHDVIIVLVLAASVFFIYAKVHTFQFVTFDDPDYVVNNVQVHQGLTFASTAWAFRFSSHGDSSYWMPLTWLSHMLDVELFGLDPGKHHMSNVMYHALNSVLLFLVLRTMTGSRWRSAFVAALFAVHPVNVDSVAWVAERKNLLSTTFWMLALLSYWFYARRPGMIRYGLVAVAMGMGLLAKGMLVTLPFVLLLLDYWPLRRLGPYPQGGESGRWMPWVRDSMRLAVEKAPLMILAIAFVFVIRLSLHYTGQIVSHHTVSMDLRIKNAVVSYLEYMGMMVWPADLSVFHPFPGVIPAWQVAGSLLVLVFITGLSLLWSRKRPYMVVGWLWFLGTLVPVLGIVQAGLWPAIAERWAYVPYAGLFIITSWGAAELIPGMHSRKHVLGAAAAVLLLAFSVRSWFQLEHWRDDFNLFGHALNVNANNLPAHFNLAMALAAEGDIGAAVRHYRECVRIQPDLMESHFNLALNLERLGRIDEAEKHYIEATRLDPGRVDARVNLGALYLAHGRKQEALSILNEAVRIDPANARVRNSLGMVLESLGNMEAAASHYREALRLDPGHVAAHTGLGVVLVAQGRFEEAAAAFAIAVKLDPSDAAARCNFGHVLLKTGRVEEAIREYSAAQRADPSLAEAASGLKAAMDARSRALTSEIETLRQSLRNGTGEPEAYARLGDLFLATGDARESAAFYRKALALRSGDRTLMLKLARALSMAGDYDEAILIFIQALEKKPGDADTMYNIACAYARLNRRDDAVLWLQKAIAGGFRDKGLLKTDPDLESIRDTDFYRGILKDLR